MSKVMLAYVHARANRRNEARRLLAEIESAQDPAVKRLKVDLAHVYIALGESETALVRLEEALAGGSFSSLLGLDDSPDMDAVRDNPRFQRIVAAVRADASENIRSDGQK